MLAAKGALNDAKGRLNTLMEKVTFDQGNLDSWTKFVVDEGARCQHLRTRRPQQTVKKADLIKVYYPSVNNIGRMR